MCRSLPCRGLLVLALLVACSSAVDAQSSRRLLQPQPTGPGNRANPSLPTGPGTLNRRGLPGSRISLSKQSFNLAFVEISLVTETPEQPPAAAQGCLAAKPGNPFKVLATGDSTTLGSVPSLNKASPYTDRLEALLPAQLKGSELQVDLAAIGNAGMFQKFNGQTVPDAAEPFLARQSYDLVVVMVGINDLLAGGRSADEVMGALKTFYERITKTGASVLAVAPMAAPGFVARDDGKEAQRRQLAFLMGATVTSWQERTKGQGPQLYFLNPEARGLDFYGMSDGERRRLMDDGLHLSQQGYQRLGELVAEAITQQLC